MISSIPRSWRWPPARRTSFQAWSTRLATAIVSISEARQPSMIVEMPAVTRPVWYSTCEPIQNHASGWGPNRLRQSSVSSSSRAGGQQPVQSAGGAAPTARRPRGSARAPCPAGAR